MENVHISLKDLFQEEFYRMVAVISKKFGLQYIEIAEDIVSETFLLAAESWGIKGLPENPAAWLYMVAKQKALYHFRRSKIYKESVIPGISTEQEKLHDADLDFSSENIKDSQLRMLFAVCNPAVASEAQIGLALRILCGFGIDEIADAFLTNKETINKRLFRAKEKLRAENVQLELPSGNEITSRLDNVLHVIYLLFNEGYYSKTQNKILRKEMCIEAMRLGLMLTEYEKTNLPKTNALIALMCFHSSRFGARLPDNPITQGMILYDDQDEALWDKELISKGLYYLSESAAGDEITSYHLEARIASWHSVKEDSMDKWKNILHLYDQLLLVNYSPGVVLNRLYALYKVAGAKDALPEAEKLKLEHNHFYFILLAEFYSGKDDKKALTCLQKAFVTAKTKTEKAFIEEKMKKLGQSRHTVDMN